MNRDPIVVLVDAPLETAAALMIRNRYRHLPVVGPEGRLVALLDDAAVFARGEWASGAWQVYDRRDADLRVSDVAGPARVVVYPQDLLEVAVRPMLEASEEPEAFGEDCAVVVDGERRPVGILTAYDVIRHSPALLSPTLTTEDLARSDVITISRGQSVGTAIDTMRAHGVRHLVVTEAAPGGQTRPSSVVSWRSLQEAGGARRRSAPLDTHAVEHVRAGAPVQEIAERMVTQKVGCLAVVDGSGALLGIVSRSDLMGAVLAVLG